MRATSVPLCRQVIDSDEECEPGVGRAWSNESGPRAGKVGEGLQQDSGLR